jgi:tetratricopeptide (TPR) repeat protein
MLSSKIVPASRCLDRCVLLVFLLVGSACGAAPGRVTQARTPAATRSSDAEQSALALETKAKLDRAQGRLTVLDGHRRERLDRALEALQKSARETGFTDLDVLVELSAREIERGSLGGGKDADRDLASAEANLGRVLAIDEHSASALNQLALLHLAKANKLGRSELELAMGVCLRAMREHPTFAPLRNTTGLVQFEIHDATGAIREFEAALKLDPSHSGARMNLAATLLSDRRFEAAERAFDRVIDLRSGEYEAYLGRALARRGQINDANFRAQIASVEADLERCKALDPERPEAYFDDAILNERFKAAAAPTGKATSALERARTLFDTFIAKAGQRPEYAREVRLAKQRVQDLLFSERAAKRPRD